MAQADGAAAGSGGGGRLADAPAPPADGAIPPGLGAWAAVALVEVAAALFVLLSAVEDASVQTADPLQAVFEVAIVAPTAIGLVHCARQARRAGGGLWLLPLLAFALTVPSLLLGWAVDGPANAGREVWPDEPSHCGASAYGFVPRAVTDPLGYVHAYAGGVLVLASAAGGVAALAQPGARARAVGVWLCLAALAGALAWQSALALYTYFCATPWS